MKGIVVCCDGEKSLKKDLSLLKSKNKKQLKKKRLFSVLDIFAINLNENMETTGR